jgi:hypothetical protein
MLNFLDYPPVDNMLRKDRIKRLYKKLIAEGLYVQPVCLDESCSEYGYLVVSIDDTFITTGQGHDQG